MKKNRARNIVFTLFVVVQGLFPLWAVLGDDAQTRMDFTWDMFAIRRDCEVCDFEYAVGDERPRRLSWGIRPPRVRLELRTSLKEQLVLAPIPRRDDVDALRAFDALGRGPLLVHPDRPAFNARAAPQIARVRTSHRMRRVGGELCDELRAVYQEALDGADSPRWAQRDAAVWEASGRRIGLRGRCICTYNNGPSVVVANPEEELCR